MGYAQKQMLELTGRLPDLLVACVGGHGSKSYLLQDKNGQIHEAHSISARLDYPGVGPEHALFKDIKRVQYTAVTDRQALDAFSATNPSNFINPSFRKF
ncbi:hypothetical protein [Desulfobacter vibrioformis]|uniref:hypothetical protein n=1 Tax=Desulfobacter vibrioformis TaxID=34031 RepID=UPI0005596999|nr:hypothetical protein [Desulfobacter vibrioformis]